MYAVKCMLFTETAGGAKLVTTHDRFGRTSVMQFKTYRFAAQLKAKMEKDSFPIRGITQLFEVVDLDSPGWLSGNQMYVVDLTGYDGPKPMFSRSY